MFSRLQLSFRRSALTALAALAFGLAAAGTARAGQIVFSNFGDGLTYSDVGHAVAGGGAPQALAVRFTPSADLDFTQARLPLQLLEGANAMTFVLAAESADGQPGTLLESITLTGALTEQAGGGGVVATSTQHPLLQAGKNYWLVVFAPQADTTVFWMASAGDTSDGANFAVSFTADADGAWFQEPPFAPRPAFEISGTSPAPAPATLGVRVRLSANGAPLAFVTLRLTRPDSTTAEATTDASGSYSFADLAPGSYTVAPSKTNYSFAPAGQTVTLSSADQAGVDFSATSTAAPSGAAGVILISEFRLQGPAPSSPPPGDAQGELDEFIELYNTTDSDIDISGYKLDSSSGYTITLPPGAAVPARGHYLIANSGGYSLSAYAAPDLTYQGFDLQPGTGLALLDAAHQVVDAVGFAATPAPYLEGTGLTPIGGSGQYGFVRRSETGLAQDSGDNRNDFVFIATDGGSYGRAGAAGPDGPAVLGAPVPANTTAALQRNAIVKPSLVDPTQASTAPPNRVRDTRPDGCGVPGVCPSGTLDIRRRFTNVTGKPITALRFRVVAVTTMNTPGGQQADLRLLTSADTTANGGALTIRGTLLDAPSQTPPGGGLNATMTVPLPGGTLINGASVNVRFLLGVVAGGNYRFFINVEAVATPNTLRPQSSKLLPSIK